MRSRFLRFAVPLLLMGLVAAACSNNDDNSGASGATGETGASGSTGGAVECNADIKVGVAFDVGGLGDKSFNDAANAGLQKAIADGLVCEENVVTNEANASGSDRTANVQALADAGFNLIVGVGFAFSPDINTISPDYPDTSFMIVDGYATCGTACGLDNDAPAERGRLRLQGAGGFVPGRRRGGAQVPVRHDRLPRRADRPADREVRGRLHRRCEGRQPEHQGPRRVHRRRRGCVQRPDQGRGALHQDVRRRRGDHLPRVGCIGRGPVQRGRQGGQAGHRGRLGSVPDREPRAAAADPDVDAEAGGRGRVQRHRSGGRAARSPPGPRCSAWPRTASTTRSRTRPS